MKTIFVIIATLFTTAAIAMTCSTNTISMGGKVTVCTTCCTATGCMTTCL